MALEKINLNGRQAIQLYTLLGTHTKVSGNDKLKMGKLRRRLAKLLKTNEEGEHEAFEVIRTEMKFTISDIAGGVPVELLGKPALRPDGGPVESITYAPKELLSTSFELSYDTSEKSTLFRLFLDRLADEATTGRNAEHLYRVAGWFPNMQRALESTLKTSSAKEKEFEEPAPDELHGGVSDGDGDPYDRVNE